MRYYNVEDNILERVKDLDEAYKKEQSNAMKQMGYTKNNNSYYRGYNYNQSWANDIESFEPITFFEDMELKQYDERLLTAEYDPGIVHSMYNDYLKINNDFEVSIVEEEAISRCTKEILVCTFNSFGAKHGHQIKHGNVKNYVSSFKTMHKTNKFNEKNKT